jgi:hypothetical protein
VPSLHASAGHSRRTLTQIVDQSTVMLMVCIGALILVLALLILFHENANATKGYQLRTLERERSQLLLEQEILNMKVAAQQSIGVLQADEQVANMREAADIVYVEGERAVARSGR